MSDTITAPDGTKFPRKYSWPLRIFLVLYIFDMMVRSILSLTPFEDWMEDLEMVRRPMGLPSPEEKQQIAAGKHPEGYTSYGSRLAASFRDFGPFFSPLPTEKTREHLKSSEDYGRYAVAWLGTRLTFVGKLFAVDQDWPMFSPNVGTDDTVTRVRLIFDDGSIEEKHMLCEPENLMSYTRFKFYQERMLASHTGATKDTDSRLGFSNMLAHRYPTNSSGSPLKTVEYYKITYSYPSPDDDPVAVLSRQKDPQPDMVEPVFWAYDVRNKTGHWVKD